MELLELPASRATAQDQNEDLSQRLNTDGVRHEIQSVVLPISLKMYVRSENIWAILKIN